MAKKDNPPPEQDAPALGDEPKKAPASVGGGDLSTLGKIMPRATGPGNKRGER